MSDVVASVKALSPPTGTAVAWVEQNYFQDLPGMLSQAQVKAGEVQRLLTAFINALPAGDTNLSALNALTVAFTTVGQLTFNTPAQSGHIATTSFNFA